MRTPARVFVSGETPWHGMAECRQENAVFFFPPSHFERKDEKEAREARAKAICDICSVRSPCRGPACCP